MAILNIEDVESELCGCVPDMIVNRVWPSFRSSARRNGFESISGTALKTWAVDMMLRGFKISTCRRYVAGLHSFLKKLLDLDKQLEDEFRLLKNSLNEFGRNEFVRLDYNQGKISRLTRLVDKSSDCPAISVMLYLLYNVEAGLIDAVNLKCAECHTDCPQIDEVFEMTKRSPNAKYLFPLKQGKKRITQIIRELISEMHAVASDCGMNFKKSFSRESLTEIWISAAIDRGILASEIRSIVNVLPEPYSFLTLLDRQKLDADRETQIINLVAESLNSRAKQWFVMKLRLGKSPEDIKKCLERDDSRLLKELSFYYPVKTVARKVNKKIVTENIPYLPDLLFFRSSADIVGSLFSKIGELAWCFRRTNSPDSPYATISRREMTAFQRCIGNFTPDIKMELLTAAPSVSIGDSVRITGHEYLEGREGVIRKIRNADGKMTYTLKLSDFAVIRWSDVEVGEEYIEPLTTISEVNA